MAVYTGLDPSLVEPRMRARGVPVFVKPFRLIQPLHVEATPQAQAALRDKTSLTVSGSLDYQACDDKVCYNPSSIPVSWTFNLRALITERPVPQR